MTLGDLIERVHALASLDGVEGAGTDVFARQVSSIVYDSRQAAPGALFFALRGQKANGAAFAAQAVTRGAIAVVAEEPAVQASREQGLDPSNGYERLVMKDYKGRGVID